MHDDLGQQLAGDSLHSPQLLLLDLRMLLFGCPTCCIVLASEISPSRSAKHGGHFVACVSWVYQASEASERW